MPACANQPILPARNRRRPSPHLKQTNSHAQGTALQTPSRAPSTQIARDEYHTRRPSRAHRHSALNQQGKAFFRTYGHGTPFHAQRVPILFCKRKRGMARRRSPPRRGGSSDAARTLVTRRARDSGRAMPYAARQGGGRGTPQAGLEAVKDGCPTAGLGVVGVKGLRKPLIPCPISAVDARKAPSSPNGHGPFGPPFGRPPGGDHAGMPAAAAGQRKKREPCSGKKIDAHARGKPKPR